MSSEQELEKQALDWVSAITGVSVDGVSGLRSGAVLCDLINTIRPNQITKIYRGNMKFLQMENIASYIEACRKLGVPEEDLFVTVDLAEGSGVRAVLLNLHSLGRVVQKFEGYSLPVLGVKLAEKNVREFTEEQIAKAKATPTKITQGNLGMPTQAGQMSRAHQITKDPTQVKYE